MIGKLRNGTAYIALAFVAASHFSADARTPGGWVGSWSYATSPPVETPRLVRPAGVYRYRIRLTQTGDAVSIRISNPEEAIPLDVASVQVARARDPEGFATDPATVASLVFGGKRGVRLNAASSAVSEGAKLRLAPGQDLIVTLATAAESTDVPGNAGFVSDFTPADGATMESRSRPYVSLVSVHNPNATCTIVTLGDSITEGARNKDTVRRGWPDRLSDRFATLPPQRRCGVVNAGISGNRVLLDGRGVAAVDRFGRDVAAVPGVTHVIMLEGINDITRSGQPGEKPIGAADLIAGYRKIIHMAHARGIRIFGGTITPFVGYRLATPELERIRVETNKWIRSSGEFDGVVDFEAALSEGGETPIIAAEFDSGDHLHPGDVGYQAMAEAVPLQLFEARSLVSSTVVPKRGSHDVHQCSGHTLVGHESRASCRSQSAHGDARHQGLR